MSDEEDFGWEEEDIDETESLIDASHDQGKNDESSFADIQKQIFESRVIGTFVRNAYDFGGSSTLLEILCYVERKMGWKTEIIADKNALDDYMFYRYQTFDEDIWAHYINSDQYDELAHRVSLMSEKAMSEFVDVYSESTTIKKRFKNKLRKLVWTAYKNLL